MSEARIVVATVMRDWNVTGIYHASEREIALSTMAVPEKLVVDDDLTRARSRCVRWMLTKTSATHLLFWDSDIEGSRVVLDGMLRAGVDCIGAAYPKKQLGPDGRPHEYALWTRGQRIAHDGTKGEVPGVGCGFMLLTRSLLSRMWLAYDDELGCYDQGDHSVMLFHLAWDTDSTGRRILLPEDYSFCQRARMIAPVYLYTGAGSPLAHAGHHVYRGRAEDVHPSTSETATPSALAPTRPAVAPTEPGTSTP